MRMNFNIPLKPAIVLLSILTLAVTSCNTYRKINYLQDVVPDEAERIAINKGILIQPKDMISIVVSSRNPELAFTLTDRFPVRAERVLSTLIDVYNEEWITDKTRAGLMDKRALPMVEEISKSGVYPRMAIALNGIEPKERKYGYGRYGYGYGYGYRYESK